MIRFVPFYVTLLILLGLSGAVIAEHHAKSPQDKNPTSKEMKTKITKAFYAKLTGDWKGSYSLWLRPGTPARKSDINANFQPAARGNYLLMTYTWEDGGEAQEGVFLLGGHGNVATATWGDSFHMAPAPMQCKGELEAGGNKLVVKGSYSAGEGPDWGWRTEFTREGPNSLLMEAYNIMPNGVEGLAVQAELKRVIKEKN